MSNSPILLSSTQLRAALQFAAAQSEPKTYLHSVHIEYFPTKTLIIATNGKTLGIFHRPALGRSPNAVNITIPFEAVEHALDRPWQPYLFLTPLTEPPESCESWHLKDPFTSITDPYPTWRSVIPHTTSGIAGQYDPRLLLQFTKAADLLWQKPGKGRIYIAHNGPNGYARVHIIGQPDFLGVICSQGEESSILPPWLDEAGALRAPAQKESSHET